MSGMPLRGSVGMPAVCPYATTGVPSLLPVLPVVPGRGCARSARTDPVLAIPLQTGRHD